MAYLLNDSCPTCASGFSGRHNELREIADFVKTYRKGALLIHGQTGCGKTSYVHMLAKDMGYELLEVNASDIRNKEALLNTVRNAALQMSLFGTGKIILIDEVDALSGTDRGAVSTISGIIQESKWPIIITANDEMNEKVHDLKKKCRFMELPPPTHDEIYTILQGICCRNNVCYDEPVLRNIARQCGGDVRASMIDLFVASVSGNVNNTSMISTRLRNRAVEDALRIIFNTTRHEVSLSALEDTDIDINDSIMWIEENMPKEYSGKELAAGYDALSKADVFLGRIRRRQHWRFLVYANAMATAGISFAKNEMHKPMGEIRYSRNTRPLKYWIMNIKNAKKKAIAEKLAKACHTSKKKAFKHLMPYFKLQFDNKSNEIAKELGLTEEELEYIQS